VAFGYVTDWGTFWYAISPEPFPDGRVVYEVYRSNELIERGRCMPEEVEDNFALSVNAAKEVLQ
jgi:hypothetical protein